MKKQAKQIRTAGAFSLIELVIAIACAATLTFAIAVFLGNTQSTWNVLFDRVYADTVTDGFVVHNVFDSICRKASLRKVLIGDDGQSLELYYWDKGSTAPTPENFARFYLSEENLYVRHGKLQAGTWRRDEHTASMPVIVAQQVESVSFDQQGMSIHLYLEYTDDEAPPVVCSSVRHNE